MHVPVIMHAFKIHEDFRNCAFYQIQAFHFQMSLLEAAERGNIQASVDISNWAAWCSVRPYLLSTVFKCGSYL